MSLKDKFNRVQILNVIAFLIVPLLSSFISTYHIVGFFELGNYTWMAILLAVAFELGALASALSITILDKISKGAVWSIFIILIAFQIIGNVYYTFDYINSAILNNSDWLVVASDFINYWYEFETETEMRMFLSILIGIPIPLVSLAFLKTLVDYVNTLDKEKDIEIDSKSVLNGNVGGNPEIQEKTQEDSDMIDEIESDGDSESKKYTITDDEIQNEESDDDSGLIDTVLIENDDIIQDDLFDGGDEFDGDEFFNIPPPDENEEDFDIDTDVDDVEIEKLKKQKEEIENYLETFEGELENSKIVDKMIKDLQKLLIQTNGERYTEEDLRKKYFKK